MFDENKKYWYLASSKNESRILNCTFAKAHDKGIFEWSVLSCRYETKEELIENEGIPEEPCKICGNIFSTNFVKETKERLIEKNICFTCDFWQSKIAIKDDPKNRKGKWNSLSYKRR